jgi:hypothetical protein
MIFLFGGLIVAKERFSASNGWDCSAADRAGALLQIGFRIESSFG